MTTPSGKPLPPPIPMLPSQRLQDEHAPSEQHSPPDESRAHSAHALRTVADFWCGTPVPTLVRIAKRIEAIRPMEIDITVPSGEVQQYKIFWGNRKGSVKQEDLGLHDEIHGDLLRVIEGPSGTFHHIFPLGEIVYEKSARPWACDLVFVLGLREFWALSKARNDTDLNSIGQLQPYCLDYETAFPGTSYNFRVGVLDNFLRKMTTNPPDGFIRLRIQEVRWYHYHQAFHFAGRLMASDDRLIIDIHNPEENGEYRVIGQIRTDHQQGRYVGHFDDPST